MIKEIGIGAILAVFIFLLFQGINLMPLIFFFGMLGAVYYLTQNGIIARKNYKNISKRDGIITFNEIGGQKTAKKELLEALDFIINEEKIKGLGIRPLKGILLIGPPGTGKTLMAKAAANYIDSVFITASGSEFIEMYAGVGAQRVRQLFKTAREEALKKEKSNAVIFIDEIDVLAGRRGQHQSHLEYDQTLNQLLVEMDGISVDDQVRLLLIGATNRPEILDPAIMRPGRFDRVVKVDLPDKEGRIHILKLHTKNKPLDSDVDLEIIAKETFGFSGAHLESLTNEAAILALRENKNKIQQKHFLEAVDKVIMGEKLDRKPKKDELYRVAVHETGHAIISEVVRPGSVSAITITSRGNALGYMRQTPEDDMYLYTKKYIENQIAVCMAGACAEQLIIGDKSTGSSNDFEQAVKLAKKIIFSGLSSLGVVDKENVSSKTIHNETKAILKKQEIFVNSVLEKNASVINKLVNILLDQEKIGGAQFKKLLKEIQRTKIKDYEIEERIIY
ncbi:MAG: cell division protease FtsH [Thermosediminibacterales bacterium]|nr:cell division protease FtsH [Thermosediminibacterales bacterium]